MSNSSRIADLEKRVSILELQVKNGALSVALIRKDGTVGERKPVDAEGKASFTDAGGEGAVGYLIFDGHDEVAYTGNLNWWQPLTPYDTLTINAIYKVNNPR